VFKNSAESGVLKVRLVEFRTNYMHCDNRIFSLVSKKSIGYKKATEDKTSIA